MIGKQDRWQEDLFVAGPLRDLIPDDHILKQVDRILDLSWLREEVRDTYSEGQGRPSIDPEAAARLMLAGFFHNIVHDRKLLREAQVNLAIRWFAGYRLHEALPDHSSLTRIRQRWGAKKFKKVFERTVTSCMQAGLVDGETVHVDATLIRADVSWASLTEVHADRVIAENQIDGDDPTSPGGGGKQGHRRQKKLPKSKKRSSTDPDATLTTSRKSERMEPSYKQHTAVDDRAGVIVDVFTTTGEASEGKLLVQQIQNITDHTGRSIEVLTADRGYAHGRNYALLEAQEIEAIIPPQPEPKPRRLPTRKFKYDGRHKLVRCPTGRILRRSTVNDHGVVYRAQNKHCRHCPLRARCVSPSQPSRTVQISHGYEATLRARRHREYWTEETLRSYQRHRWRVEGVHGEQKTQHGLRRAVRRGLDNVSIQVYLTAATVNLKRLAALLCAYLVRYRFSEATQRCSRHDRRPRDLYLIRTDLQTEAQRKAA